MEAYLLEQFDDRIREAGDMECQTDPDGGGDEALRTRQQTAAREGVAQDVDCRSYQRQGEEQRHRQVEQADRCEVPELECLAHNQHEDQCQQRKGDAFETARAEGSQGAMLGMRTHERLLPPVARQGPGQEQANRQCHDLPEEAGVAQITPQLHQQGKHLPFAHFLSITAA